MNETTSMRVAKAAGWQFEIYSELKHDRGSTKYYTVFKPDGNEVGVNNSCGDYETIFSDHELEDIYPDFEHDANAALTLTRAGYELLLKQRGDGWEAYFRPVGKQIDMTVIMATASEASTPAAAVCAAFLALMEAVEAKGESFVVMVF